MSGFIPLSREFLNGSLWNNFALIEKGLMIELLRITPMRAKEYDLYGTPVQLEAYELCFSIKRMAAFLGVTYHCLRMFLCKLEAMKLIRKKTCRFDEVASQSKPRSKSQSKNNDEKLRVYTSITFCASVFVDIWGIDEVVSENVVENEASHKANHEHNLNNNIYTEEEEEKRENAKALKAETENPKILLDDWQSNGAICSEAWQEELARYASVGIEQISDQLDRFVRQQKCQGNYFLMQREFQRRFVRFLDTQKSKRKTKTNSNHATESIKPNVVSSQLNSESAEQTRRIDHLAAELFGTGGGGAGSDDA